MKKKTRMKIKKFRHALPYILTAVITIAVVSVGSIDKQNSASGLSIDYIANSNYKISVDVMSEYYMVADLSSALNLASSQDVASNFVMIRSMYDSGVISTGKLEKPNITDLSTERGVIEYIVSEGETMDSIAAKYGITTDQIRWSNGLKTTAISSGTKLYLPSAPGIVYTVKSSDTIDSIVSKYGGTTEEIIALNDLEVSGISEGMKIVIKNGSLPTTERPEYVPPVTYTYFYTYSGESANRKNVKVISTHFYDSGYPYPNPNPGVPGWCTWYAWYWRATSPLSLGTLGHEGRNANTWHINYSYRGVGRTPRVGAVFQTPYGGGGYGHVGVVVGINDDGSIVVREMNYSGRYVVTEATIPANYVSNFNYIY